GGALVARRSHVAAEGVDRVAVVLELELAGADVVPGLPELRPGFDDGLERGRRLGVLLLVEQRAGAVPLLGGRRPGRRGRRAQRARGGDGPPRPRPPPGWDQSA